MPNLKEQVSNAVTYFNNITKLNLSQSKIQSLVKKSNENNYMNFYKDVTKLVIDEAKNCVKNGTIGNYNGIGGHFEDMMEKLYYAKFPNHDVEINDVEYNSFISSAYENNPLYLSDIILGQERRDAKDPNTFISLSQSLADRLQRSYFDMDADADMYLDSLEQNKTQKVSNGPMFGIAVNQQDDSKKPTRERLLETLGASAPIYKAVKDEYESRNFFRKWFTFGGYRLRNALKECEQKFERYNNLLPEGEKIRGSMSDMLLQINNGMKDFSAKTEIDSNFMKEEKLDFEGQTRVNSPIPNEEIFDEERLDVTMDEDQVIADLDFQKKP